jgi:hypothetical protein
MRQFPMMQILFMCAALVACQTQRSSQEPGDSEAASELAEATAPAPGVEALREAGPGALQTLLEHYDSIPHGPARDRLEKRIDRVAGQRYATVSRLYWYTDIEKAQEAARRDGKPILSLRMLGRLDSDYSCANSRFFRVVLYANREVSDYLRDNFVLHWSSERDIPVVTVDFGDGRRMRRTVAGNSAHYILDSEGRVIDALPGLYGPKAFLTHLQRIDGLLASWTDLEGRAREDAMRAYHARRLRILQDEWKKLGIAIPFPPGKKGTPIIAAERIAISKAMVELPIVRGLGLGEELDRMRFVDSAVKTLVARAPARAHLDSQSRALVKRLAPTNWAEAPGPLDSEQFASLLENLESQLTAENLFNEYGLHVQVHSWLAGTTMQRNFATLNRRIYAELFRTPAADPWLGMATSGRFTGLPGDGLSRR